MSKRNRIEKEWDDASEAWLDFVRTGKDYYRDELNNPAAFKLIGYVKGKSVLDLACGEGYNTRILAKKGAKVSGVDFSERMIQHAKRKEAEEKLGIRYYVSEALNLACFSEGTFDLVTCFMAIQDIENYTEAIAEVSRVLKRHGRFVFSIPHPCFEEYNVKGERVEAYGRYFGITRYTLDWKMERLSKPFKTTAFHRTLTDYFTALFNSKLTVTRLVEPQPTKRGLKKHPPMEQVLKRPQSVIIESKKDF
jgi:ubiquinone/menaquinone biosynthesis C-methylase UbiE